MGAKSEAKSSFEIASLGPSPRAMGNLLHAIPGGESSRQFNPTCFAHNILAAAHGLKSSLTQSNRRNAKSSNSTRYALGGAMNWSRLSWHFCEAAFCANTKSNTFFLKAKRNLCKTRGKPKPLEGSPRETLAKREGCPSLYRETRGKPCKTCRKPKSVEGNPKETPAVEGVPEGNPCKT